MDRVYLKCTIHPGGFSGERTFTIQLANGEEWEGTASVRYLRKSNGAELGRNDPARGKSIPGAVEALIRRRSDGSVTVEVPSSDLAEVSRELMVSL